VFIEHLIDVQNNKIYKSEQDKKEQEDKEEQDTEEQEYDNHGYSEEVKDWLNLKCNVCGIPTNRHTWQCFDDDK